MILESIVLEPHAYTPALTTPVLHKGLPKLLLLMHKRLGKFLIFCARTSFLSLSILEQTGGTFLLVQHSWFSPLKIFVCFAVSRGNLGWDLLSPEKYFIQHSASSLPIPNSFQNSTNKKVLNYTDAFIPTFTMLTIKRLLLISPGNFSNVK